MTSRYRYHVLIQPVEQPNITLRDDGNRIEYLEPGLPRNKKTWHLWAEYKQAEHSLIADKIAAALMTVPEF